LRRQRLEPAQDVRDACGSPNALVGGKPGSNRKSLHKADNGSQRGRALYQHPATI